MIRIRLLAVLAIVAAFVFPGGIALAQNNPNLDLAELVVANVPGIIAAEQAAYEAGVMLVAKNQYGNAVGMLPPVSSLPNRSTLPAQKPVPAPKPDPSPTPPAPQPPPPPPIQTAKLPEKPPEVRVASVQVPAIKPAVPTASAPAVAATPAAGEKPVKPEVIGPITRTIGPWTIQIKSGIAKVWHKDSPNEVLSFPASGGNIMSYTGQKIPDREIIKGFINWPEGTNVQTKIFGAQAKDGTMFVQPVFGQKEKKPPEGFRELRPKG